MKNYDIAVIGGDGTGPEVVQESVKVLDAAARKFGLKLNYTKYDIGGERFLRELTRGLNRSSRLMQQLLPLMLDWLSASPDPDLGLLQLRNILTGPQRQATLIEAFRDSPEAAQRLCTILGTSRLMGDTIARNPDLVVRLPVPERLITQPRADLVESASDLIEWRSERRDRQEQHAADAETECPECKGIGRADHLTCRPDGNAAERARQHGGQDSGDIPHASFSPSAA